MAYQPPLHENNFNLLRLVFALLVILSHSAELRDGNRSHEILTVLFNAISFGELAVGGFFLLSGYLIVQSWVRQPQIWSFLKKRVLRIYPGFIVASVICASIVGPLASDLDDYLSHFNIAGFFRGLVLLQQPEVAPVFRGTPDALLDGAMWTIEYEFKCYLLVLLLGLTGAIRNRGLWLLITAAFFGMLLLGNSHNVTPSIGSSIPQSLARIFSIDPRLACFFFVGGGFYLFRDKIKFSGKVSFLMAGILLTSLLSLFAVIPALAITGGYLLFHFALKPIQWLRGFNSLPDVSYGVYLYGWPVQKLFLWYFPLMSMWVLFALSCLCSIFLGAISWYAVEKPCMSLRANRD